MRSLHRYLFLGTTFLALFTQNVEADNQTSTISPILPQSELPFTISIDTAPLAFSSGIHSGVFAVHGDKWLLLAGRTNGMHGFAADPFPPLKQNKTAYVVDFANQTIYTRDLDDASSGLTQNQIDTLSVTSPQYYQNGKTLYICGGYGYDTTSDLFGTKNYLTALDVPKFINWVIDPDSADPAASCIRQTTSDWLQVTGGVLACVDNHLSSLLMFGQNFTGVYTDGSNGVYTQQVRRFQIIDNGKELYVQTRKSEDPNTSYRRRDLNIVPIIDKNKQAYVALSGVFTLSVGIWTVPVEIASDGTTSMADPNNEGTFKQGMNNYVSASASLYSPSTKDNYSILLGGITFEYFNGSDFETSDEFPFTNQVTTVKRDKDAVYSQYFMDAEYPVILSTGTNPGNRLLFGAGAFFVNSPNVSLYPNGVIDLDKIKTPTVIGYVVGGIMSTLANTNTKADSTASPYIFEVTLSPNGLR